MNTTTKELLDEMIQYETKRKPIKYLQKVYDELGDREIYSINGWILLWHKKVFLKLAQPDKFEIDEVWFKQYTPFFEHIPELKEVFELHEDYISWNPKLSIEEQDEIRNYIHANYTVQIRIRRDYSRK